MSGAEPERQFVDTNILVYAHDRMSGAKSDRARELIDGLWETGTGCLSMQVLQEFFVTVTRKVAKPFTAALATDLVTQLCRWRTHSPSTEDLLAAIEIHRESKISLWDAMIIQSARRLGCPVLWSEDLNPRQVYAGVTVRNPFA